VRKGGKLCPLCGPRRWKRDSRHSALISSFKCLRLVEEYYCRAQRIAVKHPFINQIAQ
jgi:hypothetical protein